MRASALRSFTPVTSSASRCLIALACLSAPMACSDSSSSAGVTPGPAPVIPIDGSSTVFPITEAVAEEFQKKNAARVTIGVSGTGGGFKKLCAGEIAVAGASRPIKPSEVELCAKNQVSYIELPVAYDGIAVVVHRDNSFVDRMTVQELRTLWAPAAQAKVTRWSQVRAGWPDEEIHLFGAGVDSGTYDYFTQAIVGKEHASRGDYTSSEDDNVLVTGISTDKNALGFFGYAYYLENQDKLKIVPIDDEDETNGAGAIIPSVESVSNGTYQPLSRPIFIYVHAEKAKLSEVQSLIHYYLNEGRALVTEVGYIPLPDKAYALATSRFDRGTLGSVFEGKGSQVGVTIESLLSETAPATP